MKHCQQGFTFIETCIVFSIFLLIVTITPLYYSKLVKHFETEHFLQQLKSDLYFAQLYSLTKEREVYARFYPDVEKYFFRDPLVGYIVERKYPDYVEFLYDGIFEFKFNISGSTYPSGSLYLKIHGQKYRIIFHLGRGRFEVRKQ